MFAFTGDFAFSGEMYLTNDSDTIGTSADPEVNDYDSDSMAWIYFLNPFFEPDLSVSGSYSDGSITTVSRDYIPAGSYNVMAIANLPGGGDGIGFAEDVASIAGTGDDAVGIDLVLYDTLDILGRVELIETMDISSYYDDAAVSLLGWPLFEVPSNDSKMGTGVFVYNDAPIGPMVAVHAEPGASEAGDYLPYNSQYEIYSPFDDNSDFNIPIVSKTVAEYFASICGVTIDYNLATVGGNAMYDAGADDASTVGAEILFSEASTVYYLDSTLSTCSHTATTESIDGPQFFIFNVPITVDNTATIAASDSTWPVDSVTIPLRSGELTFVDLYAVP